MDATLCILAGGESRRMGQSKAELVVHGKPILAFLLERFRWTGPTMLVTAPSRRSPPGAELFDREVVDPVDGAGPLRGVLTGLENITTPIAMLTTVDMPNIGSQQLLWLCEQIRRDPSTRGLMCRRDGHVEPFPSVFRSSALEIVRAQFDAGERSVAALAQLPEFRAIDAPADWDERTWTNLNTRDDFARFVASLGAP